MPRTLTVLALGAWLLAPPARAHHSFAMFDITKAVTLTGQVKDISWTNPHVWIDIILDQPAGEVWGIEGGATQTLARQGWKRDSVNPGDKVSIEIHPMRNGSKAGSLMQVTLADGQTLSLGAQGARPTNP